MLRSYCLIVKSKSYMSTDVLCKKFSSSNGPIATTGKSKEALMNGDLIGQPHPVSNLRPFRLHIPKNESQIEKRFRKQREQVHQWNQEFWTSHNNKFVEERKAYTLANKNVDNEDSNISADKMSEFYKAFLDKNWKTHFNYNIEWYKKNANLVALEVRVKLYRLLKKYVVRKKG